MSFLFFGSVACGAISIIGLYSAFGPVVVTFGMRQSTVMGISRFTLCSSEMSVSVATTPGIHCSLLLSKSINCSLSRA